MMKGGANVSKRCAPELHGSLARGGDDRLGGKLVAGQLRIEYHSEDLRRPRVCTASGFPGPDLRPSADSSATEMNAGTKAPRVCSVIAKYLLRVGRPN